MRIGPLGAPEIIVIVIVIILIIVLPKKMPQIGKSLGKTIHNFRSGLDSGKEEAVQLSHPYMTTGNVQLFVIPWTAAPGLPVHHQLPEFTQTHVH